MPEFAGLAHCAVGLTVRISVAAAVIAAFVGVGRLATPALVADGVAMSVEELRVAVAGDIDRRDG